MNGIVAAGHHLTARAAADVMNEGGNAFDAAVAALWTACVAEPVLASPGGGGFMLTSSAERGETLLHDFFVHTPKTRRSRGQVDFHQVHIDFGVAQQAFHVGIGAAAVPGFVRGLFDVHRSYGTIPMERLVEPAVSAAREGVVLTEYQAHLFQVVAPIYTSNDEVRELYCSDIGTTGDRAIRPQLKKAGEQIRNPRLGDILELIARKTDALFYDGDIADAIIRMTRDGGGHISRGDLRSYRSISRRPVQRRYRNATIETNPPPSAGGLLIAFALEILARYDLPTYRLGTIEHIEALVAAMRATRRARSEVMGDGSPLDSMLDPELIDLYAKMVLDSPPSHRGTTHVSVMDAKGNAAAATVSNGEGCGHIVPGTGFMLNNMLGEKDLVGGRDFDRWPTDKRLSSLMAPTAVTWDGGGYAVVGSGGSSRIHTAILQVLSYLIDFGLTPAEAVNAPRLHIEEDHLDFEDFLPKSTKAELLKRWSNTTEHKTHSSWPERNMYFGGVHVAMRASDGTLVGAGDPRRAGVTVGV